MKDRRIVSVVLALIVSGGVGMAAAETLKPATRMTDDLAALHDQHWPRAQRACGST